MDLLDCILGNSEVKAFLSVYSPEEWPDVIIKLLTFSVNSVKTLACTGLTDSRDERIINISNVNESLKPHTSLQNPTGNQSRATVPDWWPPQVIPKVALDLQRLNERQMNFPKKLSKRPHKHVHSRGNKKGKENSKPLCFGDFDFKPRSATPNKKKNVVLKETFGKRWEDYIPSPKPEIQRSDLSESSEDPSRVYRTEKYRVPRVLEPVELPLH